MSGSLTTTASRPLRRGTRRSWPWPRSSVGRPTLEREKKAVAIDHQQTEVSLEDMWFDVGVTIVVSALALAAVRASNSLAIRADVPVRSLICVAAGIALSLVGVGLM